MMHSSSTPNRFDFKHCSLFELILNQFARKRTMTDVSGLNVLQEYYYAEDATETANPLWFAQASYVSWRLLL